MPAGGLRRAGFAQVSADSRILPTGGREERAEVTGLCEDRHATVRAAGALVPRTTAHLAGT
jgi:hypothetical protein